MTTRLINDADASRRGLLTAAGFTALEALSYPSITRIDGSNAAPAATLQAALDAGAKRFVLTGDLVFESTVTLSGSGYSDVVIVGAPGSTVTPPQNSVVAQDDNGALAWLRAVSPAVSTPTPVTAAAARGAYTLTVASATGLAAGDWIRVDRGRRMTFDASSGLFTAVEGEVSFASNQVIRLCAGDPIRNDQIGTSVVPSAISAISGTTVVSTTLYAIPVSSTRIQVSSIAGPGAAITGGTNGTGELWLAPQTDGDMVLQQDAGTVQPRALYQIASVAGNTLALVQPIATNILRGSTVQRVDLCSGLVIEGIDFSPNLDGFCPSGIRLESVTNSRLSGVTGAGFTRAAIDDCWSRSVVIEDAVHAGRSNALVLRHSTINGHTLNPSTSPKAPLAVNARGIPRAIYMERHRCADTVTSGARFVGAHASGIRMVGSTACLFQDCQVAMMDASLFASRDPTLLYTGGTPWGAAAVSVCQYNTTAYGEFSRQCQFIGLVASGNVAPYYETISPYRWSAQVIISDTYGIDLVGVSIGNAGRSPSTAGAWQNGLAFFDAFDCSVGDARIDGQFGAIIYYNANGTRIGRLITKETAGVANAAVGILLRSVAANSSNVIDYWEANVTYPLIEHVPGSADLSMSVLSVREGTFNGSTARSIFLAQNQTAGVTSAGDVVQLSSDGAPDYNPTWIVPNTADASKLASVWGYGSGPGVYMLVARLGERAVTASAAAVAVGDKIVGIAASKQCAADNAATLPILGVSLTNKGAGAAGTIIVTQVP